MFEIRYVSARDKPFWFALDGHLNANEFDLKIRDRRGYVICDSGKPVGVMRYNLFWDSIPFLTLIYIEEAFRGKGLGKNAVQYWENEMRESGYPMTMTSTQADEQAQQFYRSLGYRDAGCLVLDKPPYAQPLEIFLTKYINT